MAKTSCQIVKAPWPPPLQGAHSLASECRSAGGQHAARNPCFTPQPLACGRGELTESLRDFHVSAQEFFMRIACLHGIGPFTLVKKSIKDFIDDDLTTYSAALAYQILFSI